MVISKLNHHTNRYAKALTTLSQIKLKEKKETVIERARRLTKGYTVKVCFLFGWNNCGWVFGWLWALVPE